MQPYFFPYLGYYQMVNAVDHFVFYDDVNYIKRGWINRNRILVNNVPSYVTIPLHQASQNKLIKDIAFEIDDKIISRFNSTLQLNYGKAPYYKLVKDIFLEVLLASKNNIGDLAGNSVKNVAMYLGLNTQFYFSSELEFGHEKYNRGDRLIEISKGLNATKYINAQGGKELYSKDYFKSNGIELKFIKSFLAPYPQNSDTFIPGLSMIDILMNNSKEDVLAMLKQFELE